MLTMVISHRVAENVVAIQILHLMEIIYPHYSQRDLNSSLVELHVTQNVNIK